MGKLTNCEKASRFINKANLLGIDNWTFQLDEVSDEVNLVGYRNTSLDESDVLEIPDFVTYIDEDIALDTPCKTIKICKGKSYVLSDLKFGKVSDGLDELFPDEYEEIHDEWYYNPINIDEIHVESDEDFKELTDNEGTGFLKIKNVLNNRENTDRSRRNADIIQKYTLISNWDNDLNKLTYYEKQKLKNSYNLNLLEILLEKSNGINIITKDILLNTGTQEFKYIANNLFDNYYGNVTDNVVTGIIYRANKNLSRINFKYDESIGIDRKFVSNNIVDILNLADMQRKYIAGNFEINNYIFNNILLKYTDEQYDYRIEQKQIEGLFCKIQRRLIEIVDKHGLYGVEQIKNYRDKKSLFHIELTNILEMSKNYERLFGFIRENNGGLSSLSDDEYIPFDDARSVHSYKYKYDETLDRWFEYNKQLSKYLTSKKTSSVIIQIAIAFDEYYILFGKDTVDKKYINNWIHSKLTIEEQDKLLKLISSTIKWKDRYLGETSRYNAINYNKLEELLNSRDLSKLTYEELNSRYGKDIITVKTLDRQAELLGY